MRKPILKLPCPYCGGKSEGNGSFVLKDGTRKPRYWCQKCDRTFNQDTGTPLSYLKKRDLWAKMAKAMGRRFSLRKIAALLQVHLSTAWRWRHRLLAALNQPPQPTLSDEVAVSEAFVRYSEKGSRTTFGTGAHGIHRGRTPASVGERPFRRFLDGKPTYVLLACAGEQRVVSVVSQGQPTPTQLKSCLAQTLGAGAELTSLGFAPFAAACFHLGVPHREAWSPGTGIKWTPSAVKVDRLRSGLHSWLWPFRGIATRYLDRYLAWYRLPNRTARQLLVRTNTLRPLRIG